jgi:hypothetical protein
MITAAANVNTYQEDDVLDMQHASGENKFSQDCDCDWNK